MTSAQLRKPITAQLTMRGKDIIHQRGSAWVLKSWAYFVMRDGATHATSDSAYPLTADGLSIAIARCDYIARREAVKP